MRQLEQQAALHRERARIAKDILDDLGANLTQIALLGELARQDQAASEKAGERVERISVTARQAIKSLDEIEVAITVSIVEDNRGTRESLRELLARAPGLRCAGAHATGEEALRDIPAENPDVVLMDINLPGMTGIECVARLKDREPKIQVLMLTSYEESDLIFESLGAGASGYLLKNMPPAELVRAVEQVHAGGSPMSMHIARKVVNHFQHSSSEVAKLTRRELEILALLAKGYLYKEIADQLGISLSTVRAHLHTVYEKLNVQSRTQAVVKYLSQD
jgi:DNA-binding NarL/FixJ family response regulator